MNKQDANGGWMEITPENLPKAGDEVFRLRLGVSGRAFPSVDAAINCDNTTCTDWALLRYTHFRPINPPAPPRGAQETR
jgi:hypothetical protein